MARARGPARVLVFGSINTDLVVYLPRLPFPGQTVSGGTFASYPGGKGANAAVAAARSGARVSMYGAVGEDAFGAERRRSLASEGIDTAGIVAKVGVPSGVAQIWVDAGGENSIAVAPGANAAFRADDVGSLPPSSGAGDVASFQNEVPQSTTERLLARCRERGYLTIWNLAPECSVLPAAQTLRAVDFMVLNENEIEAFVNLLDAPHGSASAGETPRPRPRPPVERMEPAQAEARARRVLSLGVANVVVTLGRAGSVWVGQGGSGHQPAFAVEAVDTVGAGDCFCGVLAASLAAGLDAGAAMRRAAAGAAISVTRRGAQTSMPTGVEIEAFLAARSRPPRSS